MSTSTRSRLHTPAKVPDLPNGGRPSSGRSAAASSRWKRSIGASPVVPCIAHVGDLAHPPGEMRLERRPAGEAAARDRVVLHVADAALVLALGPRPVRRAGPRPEAPVAREGVQPRVEPHLARRRVVMLDQRPGVVEQHLLRNAAEMARSASMPSNQADCRSCRKTRT